MRAGLQAGKGWLSSYEPPPARSQNNSSPFPGMGFQDSSSQPDRSMGVGWWPPALPDTHATVTYYPSRSHSHHLTALGSQVSVLMHKLRSHFGLQVPILGKQLGPHISYIISHFCLHASFPLSFSLQSKHMFKWQLKEADMKDNYILQFL